MSQQRSQLSCGPPQTEGESIFYYEFQNSIEPQRNLILSRLVNLKQIDAETFLVVHETLTQFDPETLHVCTKLSGEAAQFSKKEKFDSIVRFLSAK